jgi:hypothetical protein
MSNLKVKIISAAEHKEILYNVINSLLAGALVFLGSIAVGEVTWRTIGMAAIATAIIAITKFKVYWDSEGTEWTKKAVGKKGQTALFSFL